MFAIGCLLPLMVLCELYIHTQTFKVSVNADWPFSNVSLDFRLKMLNSELYVKTAMRRKVPYKLAFKRYWKTLIGTAGTW